MNTLNSVSASAESSATAEQRSVPFRVVAFGATVTDPNGPGRLASGLRVRSNVRAGIVIGSTPRGIVIGSTPRK